MSSSSIVEADIEEEEDAVDTFRDSNPDDVVDTESRLLLRKTSLVLSCTWWTCHLSSAAIVKSTTPRVCPSMMKLILIE